MNTWRVSVIAEESKEARLFVVGEEVNLGINLVIH